MKRFRLFTGIALLSALSGFTCIESKAAVEKSPADAAAEAFFKLRDDKDTKPSPARFQKLIASGIGFITQNPTHNRTPAVINGLANFGNTMKEKGQAADRASWLASLKLEIINQRHSDKLGEDAQAAVAALEASTAGAAAREEYSRENLETFREKIDDLAAKPGAGRFLVTQEADYVLLLERVKMAAAEAHLTKLLEHPDPKVAAMAKDELNLIAVRKGPFDLKFTALDGRAVDFEKLRGKVVLLNFWAPGAKGAIEDHKTLRELQSSYVREGFEVVGVACDSEQNREQVAKFVKENKLSWPQYFDGKGFESELAARLNVRSVPSACLFDKTGMLVMTNVRVAKLEPDLKKLLGIKEPQMERRLPRSKK